MHRRLLGAATATSASLLLAMTAGVPMSSAAASSYPDGDQDGPHVVATGLDNPRQLSFGRSGALYVAEAGEGGSGPCFTAPEGDVCFGRTGAVTRIGHHGQRRVITGLPSIGASGTGAQANGPSDVAVKRNGKLVVSVGLGANPAERDELPRAGRLLGTVLKARVGHRDRPKLARIADLASFEAAENPVNDPDSNPVSVEALGHGYLVADAGGNTLLRVEHRGRVRVLAEFENTMVDAPPILGLPPGTQIGLEFVPTSAEVGPDGAYYVSQLTGFPFPVGGAKVWRVVPGQAPTVYAEGLTNVTDLAFARDGSLYAVQLATAGLLAVQGAPPTGSVVRIKPGGGAVEVVVDDLVAPYGIALRRHWGHHWGHHWGDHWAYVTTGSVLPNAGQVVRIRLPR